MDLTPGAKVWFVDSWDWDTIKQGTLVDKYYMNDGKDAWWSLKTSRKGTQPAVLRHKPENVLYPTKRVAKAAHRMGL
jgi:hypothetical protein